MVGLQNRFNTSPLSLMTTGIGGGTSRQDLIRLQKEREELDRQRLERILAAGPARSSGAVPTITANIQTPYARDARSIDALKKSRLAQIEQNKINKYRNALSNSNTIALGQVAPAAMSGAAQPMPEKEEDEYGFLDAMFLSNLVAGMQGGPPPTPYGTAVGGGNKTWASLPTLMRMS